MADSILRLKVESQEYDAKLKRASDGIQKYATECRKVGGTLTVVEKETLAFVQGLGKMETVSRSAKGSIGEMTKTFTDLSVLYKRLTDEEKKSPFGKALSQSLDQLKTRIKDSKEELQSIEKELGGVSMKTGDLSSVFGELGSRLGINSDLMGAVTTGTIGMTAAITAGTTAVAAAAKAWADYNSELAKQDQITTVTTGLKGADADKMTDAARSISEVYGTDFREVINAANTLMTQFGESGDNAIQLIRDGMQGMIQGDGGKLLSMIQQYAPSFRDAGVSASQLVAVIQNSEGGIFTDQNMNAIVFGIKNIRLMTKQTSEALAQLGIDGQEMSRKLSDGSLSVFEALKQVATKMQDLESGGKQAGEVMQAVFGRQGTMAGTNLAKAIAELNTNLEETKTQTGNVGQSLANLEQAQEGLNSAMRETFQMKGWEEMGNKIETHFIQKLTSIVKGLGVVIDNLDKVKYAVEAIIPGLGSLDLAFTHMGVNGKRILEGLETAAWSLLGPIGMLANTLDAIGSGAATTKVGDIVKQNKDGLIKAAGLIGSIGGNAFGKTNGGGRTPFAPSKKTGGRSGGGRNTEVVYPEGSIGQLNQELQKLKKAQDLAIDPEAWNNYQQKIDEVNEKIKALKSTYTEAAEAAKKLAEYTNAQEEYDKALSSGNFSDILKAQEALNKLRGSVNLPDGNGVMVMGNMKTGINEAFRNSNMSSGSINGFISAIKSELDKADFGSQVFDKLTEKMKDATMISNVMKELIANGVNGADLEEVGALLKEKILKGEIPDSVWEELQEQINAKLAELGIDPIKIDFETGGVKQVEKDANNMTKDWQKTASAISAVGSAMSQIENPVAKVMGTLAQAVATVALAFAQAQLQAAIQGGPWAWIAFAATGLATMISSISAIKSNAKFAEGGMVKGNSYSGDNILMPIDGGRGGYAGLNSGEIVLSAAQQSNLAQQLQGNNGEGVNRQPYVMGEQIYLGVNTYLKRSGRGELVTSR